VPEHHFVPSIGPGRVPWQPNHATHFPGFRPRVIHPWLQHFRATAIRSWLVGRLVLFRDPGPRPRLTPTRASPLMSHAPRSPRLRRKHVGDVDARRNHSAIDVRGVRAVGLGSGPTTGQAWPRKETRQDEDREVTAVNRISNRTVWFAGEGFSLNHFLSVLPACRRAAVVCFS